MKIIISILLVGFSLFLASCSTVKTVDYSSRSGASTALLKGKKDSESTFKFTSFKIIGVNGKLVDLGFTGHYFDSEVVLDQGANKIVVEAQRNDGLGRGIFLGRGEIAANLRGSRKYQVSGKYDGLIRMWIEDMQTGKRVSSITSISVRRQQPSNSGPIIYLPAN